MSKISREQVKNIAKLARLELTIEEEEKYEKELSSILDMVDKLNEVDTEALSEDDQAASLKNVFREDKLVKSTVPTEALLKNAPEREGGAIKVKKVLE